MSLLRGRNIGVRGLLLEIDFVDLSIEAPGFAAGR
jgi:hypothetical protein